MRCGQHLFGDGGLRAGGCGGRRIEAHGLPAKAENGGARFEGTFLDAFRANLHLRTADRVLLVLAEGEAVSFEDLFQLVGSIAWERLMPRDAAIHVSGKCVRSRLMSVRDCQAVSKKAIVRRMMERLGVSRLPETGACFPIGVSVVNDRARVTLDMSGEALNRRGYRHLERRGSPAGNAGRRPGGPQPLAGPACLSTIPAAARARCSLRRPSRPRPARRASRAPLPAKAIPLWTGQGWRY